jgi:DNA segregation ATPase FtsK/SpoIIIE-like protein
VNLARLILFDIGGNSLSLFSDVTHLYHPIVKDVEEGIKVLESLVIEMGRRIDIGEDVCQHLPFVVCIIDEFDDTISNIDDNKDSMRFITAIKSLILRGRKANIIMILASHDPTLKNTKVKVNLIIPRIAFQCAKSHNSSTGLGVTGAEKLPGGGAMLFKSQSGITPLQGSFVTPVEIERILSSAPIGYEDIDRLEIVEPETTDDGAVISNTAKEKADRELAKIVIWALGQDSVSARQITEQFRIGNRSSKILDKLFERGIVEAKFAKQPRKVLPVCLEDLSPDTVALLERCSYSEDRIREGFDAKGGV